MNRSFHHFCSDLLSKKGKFLYNQSVLTSKKRSVRAFFKLLVVLVLSLVLFVTTYERARPKVYDCVLFFNEPELLEIRLNELYDSVDKFVIVETIENFQGKLKPLYFEENRHLFKKFEDKIIHIAL